MGRKSRPRQGGKGTTAFNAEQFRQTLQGPLTEILAERGFNPEGLWAVAAVAHECVVARTDNFVAHRNAMVACRRGCAWCCHLAVTAFPHEVFLVADYLHKNLPDEVGAILSRAQVVVGETRGLTWGERAMRVLACPLLRDGACLAYEVRPSICVAWNSPDAGCCEAFLRADSRAMPPGTGTAESVIAITETTAEILAARGAASNKCVDFAQALSIALETPDAAEQWLSGKRIFPTPLRLPDTV
jgi:hypothetical protein